MDSAHGRIMKARKNRRHGWCKEDAVNMINIKGKEGLRVSGRGFMSNYEVGRIVFPSDMCIIKLHFNWTLNCTGSKLYQSIYLEE